MSFRNLSRRLYQFSAGLSPLVLLALAVSAYRGAPSAPRELTLERLNIVDPDGRVRLVIANRQRLPEPVLDGVRMAREDGSAPGILFYNAEGDEAGGLVFDSDTTGGRRAAYGGLMFDRYKQDQTLGLVYQEERGALTSGMQVWDRPNQSYLPTFRQVDSLRRLPPALRGQAFAQLNASGALGAQRVFVGRTPARASELRLSDARGRPRLLVTVDSLGQPSIVFLDAAGRITQRIPTP